MPPCSMFVYFQLSSDFHFLFVNPKQARIGSEKPISVCYI
uniref:Uncharacterized protein n=1 Tax=Arundo donax TaxID=35708 RepID=A0A0A8ZLY5_ARUDO